MKISHIKRFNFLVLLGVIMILAGVGLNWHGGGPLGLSSILCLAAACALLGGLPVLHVTLIKPLLTLKSEMDAFSDIWMEDKEKENLELSDFTEGLGHIHKKVDQATFKVKELEATINVFAIEKKQMETILRSLPIAVLVTDRFNELILVNDVAEKLFGFKGHEAHAKPVDEVLSWSELVDLIQETSNRKVKVPQRKVELTWQTPEGGTKVLRTVLASITDHSDNVLGVVTIIQDVTRDHEIDKMKSEFVANVSHELKAPLASIKAYTEMLLDGEANDHETQKEFFAVIDAESNRLSNMIENLLDLSRLEAGVIQMDMGKINLIKMLKSVVDTMRPSADQKKIVLNTDISQYIVPVFGDQDQLNRVFVNLVSNAIKYTPEKGTFDLTARLEGDLVRVDVSDTGYGIPEDALPKIFEKFYRVKENCKVAKGTGMGLAMVKRILEIHNAEIKVKSKPGEGSCFSVFFPSAD
ncbi:MAG: cell wall metabolism sensor histidine kinase WalK [Planctomycetes bacterium]|nr:cell wall metabolism sensor histidine kinase WalK [Planctomycetota bacterium]